LSLSDRCRTVFFHICTSDSGNKSISTLFWWLRLCRL